MIDLDRIEAYCGAAEAGPWTVAHLYGTAGYSLYSPEGALLELSGTSSRELLPVMEERNALFCGNARTDVPALVQELRAAREIIQALHDMTTPPGRAGVKGPAYGYYDTPLQKYVHVITVAFLEAT